MSLRDAVKEKHDKAEHHRFVKLLMSGYMPTEVYSDFIANQLICYKQLELIAKNAGLLDGIETIARADKIDSDYKDLKIKGKIYRSSLDYTEYLQTVPKEKLLAHIYVRHFGDMYGGQMLKKVVPGVASMYDFDDRSTLIAKVREKLDDSLSDEANVVFEYCLRLFDEVADAHDIRTT
jgi:heme oxygenase